MKILKQTLFIALFSCTMMAYSQSSEGGGVHHDHKEARMNKAKNTALTKTKKYLNKLCSNGSYDIYKKERYRNSKWKMHFTTSCGHHGEYHFDYKGNYVDTIWKN